MTTSFRDAAKQRQSVVNDYVRALRRDAGRRARATQKSKA